MLAIVVVLALGVGFYIGQNGTGAVSEQAIDITTDEPATEASAAGSNSGETTVAEGTTISTNNLTDGQKRLLGLLGVDADNLVVTPAMEACANAKVGEARMQEIIAGATPSLGEGADLLACYKQ